MVIDANHPVAPYLQVFSYTGSPVKNFHEIDLEYKRARTYGYEGTEWDRGSYTELLIGRVEVRDDCPDEIKAQLPIDKHESTLHLGRTERVRPDQG